MGWTARYEMPWRHAELVSAPTGTSKPVTKWEKRVFFPQELGVMNPLSGHEKVHIFFMKTTRKESLSFFYTVPIMFC